MNQNNVIVYPTDTVWGIGADIFNQEAHLEIEKIKQTSSGKPLSVLFPKYELLEKYVKLPDLSIDWREFFQLGSTILIPKIYFEKVPQWITYDSPLVGIRYLKELENCNFFKNLESPISTTSLNISSQLPIVEREEALKFLTNECPNATLVETNVVKPSGKSSTIIKFEGNRFTLIREGENYSLIKNVLGI